MIDLDAIRERDRDYDDIFEQQASMDPRIAHRLVAYPVADRRALLAYVDALQMKLDIAVQTLRWCALGKSPLARDYATSCETALYQLSLVERKPSPAPTATTCASCGR